MIADATGTAPARGRPPEGGGLRDRVRRRAQSAGALLLVALVSAACTSAAGAHERSHYQQDDGGQDDSGQPVEHGGHDGDHGQDGGQHDGSGGQPEDGSSGEFVEVNGGAGPEVNGLQTLGRSCEQSFLEPHTGFQDAPRCVSTQMGEVAAAEQGAQLLIVSAPDSVQVGEEFTIRVSSRNLVRDRFLGAADGGYYLESSFLNDQGLVRGHFHLGCRNLALGTEVAPEPLGGVVFFQAVEDAGGGSEPDTVEITVPGIEERGPTQCAVWAGDGSHRIPMMATAQQFPAFDAVRLLVW